MAGTRTTTFAYDGAGKRASKAVGTTTTGYTYDVNRRLPVMVEDGQRRYVWGPGLAYATDPSGSSVLHVYHKDGLGSVRALTNASGQVTDTYEYDEFGVPGRRQGTSAQPFQYTGQQRDAETGLLYLRARYYDPNPGRFLQRDPLAGRLTPPGTLNRFAANGGQ